MKTTILTGLMLVAVSAMGTLEAADAKANWEKHCAKCHGADGKGDTKMGKKLDIRDLTDAAVQAKLTDDQAFKSIKEASRRPW